MFRLIKKHIFGIQLKEKYNMFTNIMSKLSKILKCIPHLK